MLKKPKTITNKVQCNNMDERKTKHKQSNESEHRKRHSQIHSARARTVHEVDDRNINIKTRITIQYRVTHNLIYFHYSTASLKCRANSKKKQLACTDTAILFSFLYIFFLCRFSPCHCWCERHRPRTVNDSCYCWCCCLFIFFAKQ